MPSSLRTVVGSSRRASRVDPTHRSGFWSAGRIYKILYVGSTAVRPESYGVEGSETGFFTREGKQSTAMTPLGDGYR